MADTKFFINFRFLFKFGILLESIYTENILKYSYLIIYLFIMFINLFVIIINIVIWYRSLQLYTL